MEATVVAVKTVTVKCPECLNSMNVRSTAKGNYSGRGPVCKCLVFSKQKSERERHIKIVKLTAAK